MAYLKYALGRSLVESTLPIVSVSFFLTGVNFILIGIIAQLIIAKNDEKKQDINKNYIDKTFDNRNN